MSTSDLVVEYAVIVVYLAFMAAVGFVMKRFNGNSDDYFRSGARGTWWLLGPSLIMSMTSAAVFTASVGAFYEAGLAPAAINGAQFLAGFILAGALAAWFRQTRAITGPEVIRDRFGPVTHQVFSYFNMLTQPIYGSFQLLGLAIFVSAVFALPISGVVVVLGVVVGVYSVTGGRWAVMATDFLQMLTMVPVVLMVAILCLVKMGGVGEFVDQTVANGSWQLFHEPGTFSDGRYTFKWVVAVFFMQMVAQLQLGWASRFLSAKDGREANRAALCMTLIGMGLLVTYLIPAFTARVMLVPQVEAYAGIIGKPAEAAYVAVARDLLPSGLMGVVIVAMFSATASSMDTGINTNAGTIVRNVVPPLRRLLGLPPLDGRQELSWGHRVSVVLVVVILALTLYLARSQTRGLFELLLDFASRVAFPMSFPLLLALFLRGAPRLCVLLAMGFGLVLPWVFQPLLEGLLGQKLDFADRVLLVGSCTLVGYLASYALRRFETPGERAQTVEFYRRMHTPVDFGREVGAGNDADQLRTIGRLTQALAVGFFLLLLVPNDSTGRLLIAGLSAAVGLTGTIMVALARRLEARAAAAPT